ncbi:hypothetical protein ACKKBG_A15525 [Auxenochlorella protothecoides x Auxenochlorella symbiontica]
MSRFSCFIVLLLCACAAAAPTISADEELCDDQGLAGGFHKADTSSSQTQDVAVAVADQFMSSDHNPLDCGEFAAVPLQACTQVVAGLNYEVLVNITCADGGSIVVLGTAFVGLPVDGKQQIEVESAEEVSP